MLHLSSRRFLTLAGSLLLILVFVLAATRTADAQGAAGSLAAILAALDELQSTVEQLLPGDPDTVRFTPPARFLVFEQIHCQVVNVSDAPRTIRTEVNFQFSDGGFGSSIREVEVAAGKLFNVGIFANQEQLDAYCKFTVVNGTADDIRASLGVLTSTGSEKVSLPAE